MYAAFSLSRVLLCADESLLEFPARAAPSPRGQMRPRPPLTSLILIRGRRRWRTTMAVTSARPADAFTYKDENQQNPWGREGGEGSGEPCHAMLLVHFHKFFLPLSLASPSWDYCPSLPHPNFYRAMAGWRLHFFFFCHFTRSIQQHKFL